MQKIKTGTVTFHASHNYGSMLQAYALQRTLTDVLGVDNEIINFRSEAQKKYYQLQDKKTETKKQKLLKLIIGSNDNALKKKFQLFEDFLEEELTLSQEFNSETEAADYSRKFDYLFSGSDQIWNTYCLDFCWLYFLPTANGNAIAYAPSMGPDAMNKVSVDNYEKIKDLVLKFKSLSVREQGTAEVIKVISGQEAEILVDPTLLVDRIEWERLAGKESLVNGDYIFMYHPFVNNEIYKISKNISRYTGLPVIVSNKLFNKADLHNKLTGNHLKYKLDCGPKEFLNLIKNSKYVISGSFHAVVFSIIFQKPFVALDGIKDNRMSQILKDTNLLKYSIDKDNYIHVFKELENIDFSQSLEYIEKERKRSLEYLKSALSQR